MAWVLLRILIRVCFFFLLCFVNCSMLFDTMTGGDFQNNVIFRVSYPLNILFLFFFNVDPFFLSFWFGWLGKNGFVIFFFFTFWFIRLTIHAFLLAKAKLMCISFRLKFCFGKCFRVGFESPVACGVNHESSATPVFMIIYFIFCFRWDEATA